jgi:hypothetical protein
MSDDLSGLKRRIIVQQHAPNAKVDQERDMIAMPTDEFEEALNAAYQSGMARGIMESIPSEPD